MRNYDGKEYRYKSSDFFKRKGIAVLASHLKFNPPSKDLVYDMSLYAGGIGVYDKLAARFSGNSDTWNIIKEKHHVLSPTESSKHETWSDDFNWLIERENSNESVVNCSRTFIENKMFPFQQKPSEDSLIYFVEWSDVNDWALFWGADGQVNYLSFSQG